MSQARDFFFPSMSVSHIYKSPSSALLVLLAFIEVKLSKDSILVGYGDDDD